MEAILEYVSPELLILVPVLYFVGMGLKKAGWFSDTLIPVSLGGIGVALSFPWVLATSPLSGWQDARLAMRFYDRNGSLGRNALGRP